MRKFGEEAPRRIAPSLDHVFRMTTEVGMLQHSRFSTPDPRFGYTTDDNARALLVAAWYASRKRGRAIAPLAGVYMRFVERAQRRDGWFHNFTDASGRFIDERGSEDCLGRVIWGCASALAHGLSGGVSLRAERVLQRSLGVVERLKYPRGVAYAILGLEELSRIAHYGEVARKYTRRLADGLISAFRHNSGPGWIWPEDRLTYANALIPAGLAAAYLVLKDEECLELAESSMDFLVSSTWRDGCFKLVGNRGWYVRGGTPADYDEQPVDAGYMALACLKLFQATEDDSYVDMAQYARAWFYGRNSKEAWLYDPITGGCYDGLTSGGVNLNQGAESVLALHMASLAADEAAEGARTSTAAV